MIVDLIRPLISGITPMVNPDVNGQPLPFTFYTGTLDEINRLDDIASPCIVMPRPVVGKDILRDYGVAGVNYNVQIFFLVKSLLTDSMDQREAWIAKMVRAKDQLIALIINKINSAAVDAMDNTTQFEFFGRINSTRHEEMFNEDDFVYDGIGLTLDIDTAKNTCSFFLS